MDRYRASRGGYTGTGGYREAPAANYYNNNSYPGDRDENGYDPSRYYRSGDNYRERVLSADERVYAGNDGSLLLQAQRRHDRLVIGGAAGAHSGNVIDGGRSRIVGTLLGGAAGALAGKAIDQNQSQSAAAEVTGRAGDGAPPLILRHPRTRSGSTRARGGW